MIEQPPGFRRGEHRIQRQSAAAPDRSGNGGVLAAQGRGPLVLPADQGGSALSGPPVPQQKGFPLGAQPDTDDLVRVCALEAGLNRYLEAVPDLGRGLLYPSAARVVHGQVGCPPGYHITDPVDQCGLRRARALIDGQDERFSVRHEP